MKRKFLEDLGLVKEAIDKILDENSADIGKAKSDLETITSERDKLKDDIADRDKQLEALKKVDAAGLQAEIDRLQKENKATKEKHEAELKKLQVDTAVSAALAAAKAKNERAVKALLELDPEKTELLEDGTIKGLDDQLKKLQEGEDSKFLFEATDTKNQNTFKGIKPGEKKDGTPGSLTKEQFNKMSYKERVNLYNTDKATYDALTGKE